MNSNKTISSIVLLTSCLLPLTSCIFLYAADISAPKMEIVDSEQGRLTIFPQGITIIDKDTKITGKNAIFYERDNRAEIYDSILIINPQLTITADTVFYSFTEKTSRLRGNVIVESDTLQIKTSTLVFDQSRNLVIAQDDVKIREKLQRLTIYSKKGEYNFTDDIGIVDSQPVLHIERNDTIIVRGQKMILENKQSRFIAIDNVSAQTNKTMLTCDTLLFFTNRDYGIAQGNPSISENENLLFGKIIEFYFTDTTNSGQTNLSNIKVLEQANATYLTSDGGLLKVQGSQFSIDYQAGDIKEIRVFGDSLKYVSGTFTPKQEL